MTVIKFKIFATFFILTLLSCMLLFFLKIKKEFKQHKLFKQQLNDKIQLETEKLNSLKGRVVLNDKLTKTMQNNMFEVCRGLLEIVKNV